MSTQPTFPVVQMNPGAKAGDQDHWASIPDPQSLSTDLSVAPGPGTWAALVALSGMSGAGYVIAKLSPSNTLVRIPLLK